MKKDYKEGVDFVFEQHPELNKIGSEKEYSKYLKTIFPESKVQEIVYHGGQEGINEFLNPFEHSKEKLHSKFHFNKKRYGIYFTPDSKEAKSYSDTFNNIGKKGKVYPVLLNAISPKKGKDVIFYGAAAIKNIVKLFNKNYTNLQSITEQDINTLSQEGVDAIEWTDKNQYIVFEPKKIHILGSKADAEKFKEYIKNKNSQTSKSNSLEGKIISEIFILSFIIGLFFLSPNLTGNVIGISQSKNNLLGIVLTLTGIFGFFIYRKLK
jgi:hypothetical protein